MSPYTKYQESQTLTADPGTLVLMLYDGGIAALKRAKQMLEAPSYRHDEFSKEIVKAQNIVMELIASLNFDAGEIAQNLWRLYEYMVWQLRRADFQKDPNLIEDVLSHLTSLHEAWQQIVEQPSAPGGFVPAPKPQDYSRGFMVA